MEKLKISATQGVKGVKCLLSKSLVNSRHSSQMIGGQSKQRVARSILSWLQSRQHLGQSPISILTKQLLDWRAEISFTCLPCGFGVALGSAMAVVAPEGRAGKAGWEDPANTKALVRLSRS